MKISHDEHATVTEDDGTVLWSGWLDGRDEPAPSDAEAKIAAIREYFDRRAREFSASMFAVRPQDMRVSAGVVLAIIDGLPLPSADEDD